MTSISAQDVSAVLSPIVAGAANLAKRLAAHKAAANAGAAPVADEGVATMGPLSPLDVSLDPGYCHDKKSSALIVHFDIKNFFFQKVSYKSVFLR